MSNSAEVFIDPKTKCCAAAYCDCEFPTCMEVSSHKGHITDLVKCRCGEEDAHTMLWQWHKSDDSDTQIVGNDITFHPVYSQGTAIIRGEKPLNANMVHFWEMRVLTALVGTDVMFGIGTDCVNLEQFKFHFVSALGTNSQSWGYSYHGKTQYNGEQLPYGQKFSQGCIIGVYVDRTRGYIEFYLNRRPLGVAFTNIPTDPSIKLYPMVCSTAAKCSIRLINSTAQAECLQLRAFQVLSKQPKKLDELRRMPGLRTIAKNCWFMSPPVRYSQQSTENEYDILDEAVLSTTLRSRLGRKQKFKDEDADINDLYSNAHKIAIHRRSTNGVNELSSISEYCDEYFHYLL